MTELVNLTCYGDVYLANIPFRGSKTIANEHIRTCPKGEMPWAKRIEWHETDRGVWVSAQGSWLNHHIVPADMQWFTINGGDRHTVQSMTLGTRDGALRFGATGGDWPLPPMGVLLDLLVEAGGVRYAGKAICHSYTAELYEPVTAWFVFSGEVTRRFA